MCLKCRHLTATALLGLQKTPESKHREQDKLIVNTKDSPKFSQEKVRTRNIEVKVEYEKNIEENSFICNSMKSANGMNSKELSIHNSFSSNVNKLQYATSSIKTKRVIREFIQDEENKDEILVVLGRKIKEIQETQAKRKIKKNNKLLKTKELLLEGPLFQHTHKIRAARCHNK